jgi:hypothetical protein
VILSIDVRGAGAVEDGAELARIEIQPTASQPKIQMQHQFVFGVTFAEPTITWNPSIDVLDILTMIGVETARVVDRFTPLSRSWTTS